MSSSQVFLQFLYRRDFEKEIPSKTSDFSIDYILNRAGEKYVGANLSISLAQRIKYSSLLSYEYLFRDSSNQQQRQKQEVPMMYDWLQYTRYHPPKLPRSFRHGPVKRAPGRLPRVPFTPEQLQSLENAYKNTAYLSSEDANKLADQLELTSIRVKIWFQNRRARERREKREIIQACDSSIQSSSPEPQKISIN